MLITDQPGYPKYWYVSEAHLLYRQLEAYEPLEFWYREEHWTWSRCDLDDLERCGARPCIPVLGPLTQGGTTGRVLLQDLDSEPKQTRWVTC